MADDGLTIEEVEHIALLARLSLSRDEIETFREQLSDILDYAASLQELDTDAIPPTAQVLGQNSVMRDDEQRPSLSQADVLANAPETFEGYFMVPTVLDENG